jgi:hypothetical protein
MFNKLKLLGSCLAAFVMSTASQAGASVSSNVEVLSITILTDAVIISVTPAPTGRPACHQGSTSEYAFGITTSNGMAMLAQAQAALIAGKEITITGTATCSTTGGGQYEQVASLRNVRAIVR